MVKVGIQGSIKRSQSIARLHATPRETFHQERQTRRLPTGADVLPPRPAGEDLLLGLEEDTDPTAAADLRGPGLPRRTCSEWRELQKWSPDSTPATELVAGGEDAGQLLRRRTVATLGRRFAAGPPGAGQDSDPFRSPAGFRSPARQPQKHVAATAVESPPLGVRAVDTRAAIRQSSSPLGSATGGSA